MLDISASFFELPIDPRSEIENAAADSRQLADDLASMLARLEIQPR